MADAELIRHQETWKSFTSLIKWGLGGVITLLVLLAIFVVR